MRHGLALAALLLPLSGCYVPPQGPTYAQPGYAYQQPGYVQPGYPPPEYAPVPDDSDDNVYPGYSYNDGAPTLYVDGVTEPLVFFDGGWGYYDRGHGWHRAPDAVGRRLEQRRASGAAFRPGGGGFQPGRPAPGGEPFRDGQSSFRPAAVPPQSGFRPGPGAPAPQSGFRPAAVAPQSGFRPGPGAPPPQSGFRPGPGVAPPQGGFHGAAPPPARHECPPGQHC